VVPYPDRRSVAVTRREAERVSAELGARRAPCEGGAVRLDVAGGQVLRGVHAWEGKSTTRLVTD